LPADLSNVQRQQKVPDIEREQDPSTHHPFSRRSFTAVFKESSVLEAA
jgi:hypothetical protein